MDRALSLIVDLRCISSSVFHAARTLSGSLRSPPSPRGEGFIRRYSFSTYACFCSDIMGKAVFSYRSLPHWGRGTAPAVDRALSLIVDLRCISSSVFHAARTLSGSLRSPPSPRGEGFIRRYSFSTYACIRSDIMGKAVFSYRSPPPWGRGTAPAVDRVLSYIAGLRRIIHLFQLSFIPPVPYPPLRGTFPSRGRLCPALFFFYMCVYSL